MPYVMVPVPEEHEKEVMEEVMKMSLRDRLNAWDAEPLQALVGELDETSHRLVTMLAEASVAGRRLSRSEVAASLGVERSTLAPMIETINGRSTARSMPFLVLSAPNKGPADDMDLLITKVAAEHIVAVEDPGLSA